jgi:hypothetical protein
MYYQQAIDLSRRLEDLPDRRGPLCDVRSGMARCAISTAGRMAACDSRRSRKAFLCRLAGQSLGRQKLDFHIRSQNKPQIIGRWVVLSFRHLWFALCFSRRATQTRSWSGARDCFSLALRSVLFIFPNPKPGGMGVEYIQNLFFRRPPPLSYHHRQMYLVRMPDHPIRKCTLPGQVVICADRKIVTL